MAGNHYTPLAWMHSGFCARGVHLVSHNYRLGPQASVEQQIEDCLAAAAWCRGNLPRILGEDRIDVDRFIVCGESAGGLLTALMGMHLHPAPRAVVCVYGVMDPSSAWPLWSEATEQRDDKAAVPWNGVFSDEELEEFLKDRDPANLLTDAFWWDEDTQFSAADLSSCWATPIRYTRRQHLQSELHRWRSDLAARPDSGVRSIRLGTLHEEKFAGDKSALATFVSNYSALQLLDKKTTYPPTAFLHGTGDVAAPLQQSLDMASKVKGMGVEVLEVYPEGMGHCFDEKYTVSSKVHTCPRFL
jgi:acetyl esterase/lipase